MYKLSFFGDRKKSLVACGTMLIILFGYFGFSQWSGLRFITPWADRIALPLSVLLLAIIFLIISLQAKNYKKKPLHLISAILAAVLFVALPFFVAIGAMANHYEAVYYSVSPNKTHKVVVIKYHGIDDYFRAHAVRCGVFYSSKQQTDSFGAPYGELPSEESFQWLEEDCLQINVMSDETDETSQILAFY